MEFYKEYAYKNYFIIFVSLKIKYSMIKDIIPSIKVLA